MEVDRMNLPGSPVTAEDLTRLAACGISADGAARAMLRRVTSTQGAAIVGRNGTGDYAGIIFPYVSPGTEDVREYRLRRDHPELEYDASGKPKERDKYLSPPGRGNMLYFVPGTPPEFLADTTLPLVITEGEKKTLALWAVAWDGLGDTAERPLFLPVGLSGVWGWRGSIGKANGPDGDRRNVKGAIPDLGRIEWKNRKVIILFDRNTRNNESVQAARAQLTAELRRRRANVFWFVWPGKTPDSVNGIDDLLAITGPARILELIDAAKPYRTAATVEPPVGLTVDDLLALPTPARHMLIETVLPTPGGMLLVGSHKTGKTVAAVQMAISVASGQAFMGLYKVPKSGAVIIVEQDDPAGDLAVRDYLKVSPIPVAGLPIVTFTRLQLRFGPEFCGWLDFEIRDRHAKLVILDSYTALRPHRRPGLDIVKTEQEEVGLLDALAKRTGSTILILTHDSKGSFGMDWSDRTAGTFAMGAAVEGQMHVSRFRDLAVNAPERLIQIRGRHIEDVEAVLRFRRETLDYEMVLEGGAASLYPELLQVKNEFGDTAFGPKELSHQTGASRATANRIICRLAGAGILTRVGFGEYRLSAGLHLK